MSRVARDRLLCCKACREPFTVPPKQNGRPRDFCSSKCWGIHRSHYYILVRIRGQTQNPIYQVKQLGLVTVSYQSKYEKKGTTFKRTKYDKVLTYNV